MSERSVALYPPEFGEAPLSLAFREAWIEWRETWEGIAGLSNAGNEQVERMAEATILVVRRLWRAAFASVGASSSSQVKAMVYAFVALVDERLLFDEWPGRTAWQPRPLEARLYGSRTAGERLPRAIHKLLKERAPASRDLANVYLQCLILGFYGGLRSDRGRALHTRWRHALFTFAWQREPAAAEVISSLARPTRASPLRLPLRRALPDGVRLSLAICGLLLLLSLAGHWMWRDIQSELTPLLHLVSLDEAQ
ncbi:DotU family type IV/VI secretion system protein [Ectopseudomonas khazarica]|jgi:type VI secretion system protein ImpK|uniref:DotU family type IV/VI secretion system protein n=1 Tax=Ectopseudomonas khazarica TaxID=2502979 RepID=UPI000565163D|nr:DotU/TssL family secretion system protein [Pseudomonas khazarica]